MRCGDVKLGAGNVVKLTPSTPYTDDRYERSAVHGVWPGPAHLGLDRHVRKTVADAQGRFEFRDLPAGTYYVTCMITWQAGYSLTGGEAMAVVTVAERETKDVVVTR